METQNFQESIEKQNLQESVAEIIKELEILVQDILKQIKAKIESNYYDAILADDVSGRIPGLIFKQLIDTVSHNKGEKKSIELVFVAGGNALTDDEENAKITQLTKELKKFSGKNILVVTENIATGKGLKLTIDILKKVNANAEIAALSSGREDEVLRQNIKVPVYAGRAETPPSIWHRHDLVGVEKRDRDPHSHLYGKNQFTKNKKIVHDTIKQISEELAGWFEKNN